MSNSIDQRIVEMQFDSAQFEKGIESTLNSLKKLDENLSMENGIKGLEQIDKAVSNVDVAKLGQAAEQAGNKFDAMAILAERAIKRVADGILNLGQSVVQGITLQPLTDGLDEYHLKMNSIKTIQTNTLGKSSLDDINGALQELNTYADKTIYNFAEMTRNIGTFTSAGVELETSTTAIKGIANLAAASGASSQQASMVMYQLSQALSSGTVRLQDWVSVVNGGMGGQLFQNALIRTSEALHSIGQEENSAIEAIESFGSFRDSLTEGKWLTSNVLLQTLENMTYATNSMTQEEIDLAHEKLKNLGYTEEMIQKTFEEANAAEEAATKVRTFEGFIDTTKEALGSGWAQSWEYIIGDLGEAEDLWTGISNTVTGLLDGMADARNAVLKAWHDNGGREAIVRGMANIVDTVAAFIEPIKTAFGNVFQGIDGKKLANLSAHFRYFTAEIKRTVTESNTFKIVFQVITAVFTVLFGAIKAVTMLIGGAFLLAFKAAELAVRGVWTVIEGLATAVVTVVGWIQTAVGSVATILGSFGEQIASFTGLDSLKSVFVDIGTGIDQLFQAIKGEDGAMDKLSGTLQTLRSDMGPVLEAVSGKFAEFGEKAKEAFGYLKDKAPEYAAKAYGVLLTVFEKLKPIFQPVVDGLKKIKDAFTESLGELDFSGANFDVLKSTISNAFASITDFTDPKQMANLGSKVRSAIKNFFESIFQDVQSFMTSFTGKLGEDFSISGIIDKVAGNLTQGFEKLSGKFEGVRSFLDSLLGGNSIFENLKSFFSRIKELFSTGDVEQTANQAEQVGSVVSKVAEGVSKAKSSLSILGNVKDFMDSPLKAIGGFLGDIAHDFGDGINEFTSRLDMGRISKFVSLLASIGTAAGVIVGVYKFAKAVAGIAKLIEALGDIGEHLSNLIKSFEGLSKAQTRVLNTAAILNLCAGLVAVAGALALLALIGPDRLWAVLPILVILTAVIIGISALMSLVKGKLKDKFDVSGMGEIALGVVQLALSMLTIAAVAAIFSAIGPQILPGLAMMGAILIAIGLVAAAVSVISADQFSKLGSTMLSISVAMLGFIAAIAILGTMDLGTLVQGTLALGAIMVFIGLMGGLIALGSSIGNGSKSLAGLAVTMLAVSVVIGICTAVVKSLGDIDPAALQQGMSALAKMMIAIVLMNAVMAIISRFSEGIGSGAATLLAMSVAIGVMALAVAGLAAVMAMGGDVGGALMVLAGGLLAIGVACGLLNSISGGLAATSTSLVALTIAIAAFVAITLALSAIPFDMMLSGIINISMALGVFLLALLALGGIGEIVGFGLKAIGFAFIEFSIAIALLSAALLVAAIALGVFGAVAPQAAVGMQMFFDILKDAFSQEDMVGSMIGMAVAMALVGAASLILGVGLGALALALTFLLPILGQVMDGINKFASNVTANMTNLKTSIAGGVEGMLSGVADGLGRFVVRIPAMMGNFVSSLGKGLTANKDKIKDGVLQLLDTIGTTIATGLEILVTSLPEIAGKIGTGLIKGIADAATGPLEMFNSWLYDNFGELGLGVPPVAEEAGKQIADATNEGLNSNVDELGQDAVNKVEGLGDEMASKAPEVGDGASTISQALRDGLKMPDDFDLAGAFGLTPDIIAGGFDSIKSFCSESGLEIPDSVIQSIADGANGLDLANLLQENGNFDMTEIQEMITQQGGEIPSWLESGAQEGAATMDLTDLFQNGMIDEGALSEKFKSAGRAGANGFVNDFKSTLDSLDGAESAHKIAAAMEGTSSDFTAAGKALGDSTDKGMQQGMKSMKASAKDAVKGVNQAVSGQASSAYSAGKSVGTNIGNGLTAGINSTVNSATRAAEKLAAIVQKVVELKAKISSPSRVFMQLGAYMGEGLAIGLESTSHRVAQASEEMADSAISAAMDEMGYLTGLIEDLDDQPVIRPVLDLTDYNAALRNMQGFDTATQMVSAQFANRAFGSSLGNTTNYGNNNNVTVVLDWNAGTSAIEAANMIARTLQSKNLMEA